MTISTAETKARAKHISLSQIPVEQLNPLLDRQFVHGERAMLARLVLRKGCLVPMHDHENEQISHILEGALKFNVGGEEIIVRTGDVLVIPPHLPHSAEALEDTLAFDIFSPPRADWISGTDAYLRK